jgi:hypothetical protein
MGVKYGVDEVMAVPIDRHQVSEVLLAKTPIGAMMQIPTTETPRRAAHDAARRTAMTLPPLSIPAPADL